MSYQPKLSVEDVHRNIVYDPLSGAFTRRISGKRTRYGTPQAGDEIGFVNKAGYTVISLFTVKNPAARIAFVLMHGRWPVYDMDHIDRNPRNNKWDNLREATPLLNQQNRVYVARSKTKVVGVCFMEKSGKWRPRVRYNGRTYYPGGLYNTCEEAKAAYDAKKREFYETAMRES